jgi:hypothetical protein
MMLSANLLKVVTTSKDFLNLSCLVSSTLLDHPAHKHSCVSNPDPDKKACHLSGEKIPYLLPLSNHGQNRHIKINFL